MTEESMATACSAREVLEEFNKSSVRVAWPRLADLLEVPPQMQHRIQRLHEYKLDPALLVKEEESLRQVLSYWENNDPNHTWETLSLALMSDRIYKELGASLYFKHVKPEEFTLDKVYEEVKEITNPREIAYVLIQDSKKLREIWGEKADELTPEERAKLAINHWMTSHPEASWMLLAKHIEWFIHGEHEAAAQRIATTIREKYLPKVEEKMGFGPPKESEERKFPEKFGANEAFQQLTAVEDWFGLGWFLEIEEEELKQIEKEHGRDDDRKLAMLKLWVELNPKSSWNSLTTAVKKMPQHQSLAEDIQENFLEQERRRIIQKELEERSKELYNQFFQPLFESLCNEQVYSSLVDQLVSMSLISEADKETLLSSTRHPKVRATSLLEVLNIEEKPHLMMELIKAMEEVEALKGLADEMMTQHRANEAGEDVSKKIERQLTGVNVVDERVFKLEGRKAQPLLWEEHGFRMFIPEDALLPYETCHVSVKAIVGGRFQFPKGTEPVSAVYAISLSRQLRKPARTEMQHCVKLENPEHSKSMSFAVASQDPSSMPYQFHAIPGGIFEENKFFGSVDRQQFSFMTIIWKLLGYGQLLSAVCYLDIECIYSASTFTQKAKMDEQLWILAVSKDLDTMKRYLTSSLKEAEQEVEEATFEFEKEELTLEILDEATPGWIIEPLITPCTITRRQVESRIQPHNIEHGPIVCKVRIAIEKPSRPPDEVLRNRIRLDGIKPEHCFNIHFKPPLLRTDSQGSTSRRALLSSVSSSSSSFTYSFDSPPSLDSVVPTQRDFCKMVIEKIPTKWKKFGIMMNIDIERLEGIFLDKRNIEDCFLEVYRIGKSELDQPFTWKRVLDILHDLKEYSLRDKIQEKIQD